MPNHEQLTKASAKLLTEQRADIARWLAIEVLVLDDTVMADTDLANRLIALQDRLTDEMTKTVLKP